MERNKELNWFKTLVMLLIAILILILFILTPRLWVFIFIAIPLFRFFATPMYRKTKIYNYLSDLIFTIKGSENTINLHNGTLYDYFITLKEGYKKNKSVKIIMVMS